jgi:outer membrane protein assembly factor BamB
MPATKVVTVNDMKMSPSGKLLAVAGQEGLQIFHFNGADPITKYTGLLTTDPVAQMFWDNSNHLYAISPTTGKLRVYTITPTSFEEPAGSPYDIEKPDTLIVQPLPLP